MYDTFFGLSQAPFKITPDTDVFFKGGNRGAILEALIYAICQGEGIIKVTGEVGSGKTMLCRMLETRLPPEVETIYIANPGVPAEEILHAIAFELRLPVPRSAGRIEVMHALNNHLLERHAHGKQVVMFVEESQGMPIVTMEEIRLLSNLETKQHKLLQIVLFGQPELDEILATPKIRQLRERITHSFLLTPLTEKDVHDYIIFRLQAAGYRGPDLFSRPVVDQITRASKGLTRRVNILADKTLLAAFADGTHNVSLKHAKTAVRDSAFCQSPPPRFQASPLAYVLGGLVLGGLLGAAAVAAYIVMQPAADLRPGPEAVHGRQETPATVFRATITPGAAPAPQSVVPVEPARPRADTAAREPSSPDESPRVAPLPVPTPSLEETPPPPQPSPMPASPSNGATVSAASPNAPPDLVEQRLVATRKWLAETAQDRFSIQLLITRDRDNLRNFLSIIQTQLEIERVFVYHTMAQKRPCLAVLYGSFASRAETIAEIEKLPPKLKVNHPRYRTIRGIRAEIASNDK